ncbi:SHOCT domain-containing protein [Geothrix mesophila]|uniref:SHOCT domain-containing protein n=1 Tax=Geothrix mesophila TaxID=2922723 RepID=UPI001FABAF83|nr:SHOCT domain-containing protein [Geothrix sp. SG198]
MRHRSEVMRAPMLRPVLMLVLMAALLPGLSVRAADPGRTQWKLANFTWVNRVPAEVGVAANGHPAQVSQAVLQKALGAVMAQVDGADTPLFEPKEAAALAKALEEAFAAARPSEDLVLLSTQRRGGHFMDPALAVTARLFVKAGALNLIVHDARLDFMDRYSADRTLPTFAYGSRTAGTAVSLKAEGATNLRSDWLAIPLAVTPAATALAPAPTPAPASLLAPGSAASSPQAAVPAAPKPDQDFYDLQYQRLKALKRLRDENLISEAEYQEKRQAILKTL